MKITTTAILGFSIADALGVPYEFKSREEMKKNPATEMIGYGTYNQPIGTWSDDTSMLLCTVESLINGLDYNDIVKRFKMWNDTGYMTPHGVRFDIGNTTSMALNNYSEGVDPTTIGLSGERDCGNGSLMRILPFAFYLYVNHEKDLYNEIKKASSLTHAHKVPIIACSIYSLFIMAILDGASIWQSYAYVKEEIKKVYSSNEDKEYLKVFDRILENNVMMYDESEIKSSGYVVDTLEAVLWCFLNSNCYEEAVLSAVNLGGDTDTIAALTGSLAAMYYGDEDIPQSWIDSLQRKDFIIEISDKFHKSLMDAQEA